MYLRNLFSLPNKSNFLFRRNIKNKLKNIIVVKRIDNISLETCIMCLTSDKCMFNQNQLCFPK